ncbi:unnamed protein product, partial [Discosporangium mesarthrocarpum]
GAVQGTTSAVIDYTRIPGAMDRRFEKLDKDSAMRPTTITIGKEWERSSFRGLLHKSSKQFLLEKEQREERDRAMDLIDALSRSGDLPLGSCELHVVLAATHCFDESVMNTLVKANINPIDRIERSALIVASTVHGQEVPTLLAGQAYERVLEMSPMLFIRDGE